MVAPSSFDNLHLLMAIVMTTAINMMKSNETEQKRPLLLTFMDNP